MHEGCARFLSIFGDEDTSLFHWWYLSFFANDFFCYFSVICGISEDTNNVHIVKAALQAICFQIRDILEAMKEDTGLVLSKLLVDGAMTNNNLLMQMQADICGIPVGKQERRSHSELNGYMCA